jgi:hypothetical protein
MKRRPPIPLEVEPLDDARWAKIEENVLAEVARTAPEPRTSSPDEGASKPSVVRARIAAATFGFVAMAALVLLLLRTFAPTGATANGSGAAPLHVASGDSASHAIIGSAELEIGPRTEVVATGDDGRGIVVVLERGSITFEVPPRAGRPPFVVQAGDVGVRVVGTRFRVDRDLDRVTVKVTQGTVEVSHHGEIRPVHEGEQWSSRADSMPTPSTKVDVAGGETPPASPSGPTASTSGSLEPRPTSSARGPTPSPVATDDRAAYEAAARSEGFDYAGALAAYRKVAARGGPWAEPSLFAAGRLAAEHGDRATARALLQDYLRRYPNGRNAADARALLARLG